MIFVEMDTFISNNCIDIKEIDVFRNLAKEKNIDTVFYGKRAAKNAIGKCFLFVLDAVFYVFTYQSKYGEYRSIEDYTNGIKKGFDYSLDYYFSKNRQIDNYPDFSKYLLNEYSINDMSIKNYEINNAHDKTEYYLHFINIANEIEAIKEKYKLNTNEAIVCYNIINNLEQGKKYTVNGLYSICMCSIIIKKHDFEITVDFENQFHKYVEKTAALNNVIKGEWELDTEVFKVFMEKMLKMLGVGIEYHNGDDGG